MKHVNATSAKAHPWIATLRDELDHLELALLESNANGVRISSEKVLRVLQQTPSPESIRAAGPALMAEFERAAQRFARLRVAVVRANSQTERGIQSLTPHKRPSTYGPGASYRSFSGASQNFLSA